MMRNSKLLVYLEIAIMSAIGIIMDYISSITLGFAWPNGGSIGIAMIVVVIMAFRRGLWAGLLTGFIVGLVQIIYAGEGYVINIVQAFFDFYGAYMVVGLAGIFYPLVRRGSKGQAITFMVLGTFIGSMVRFAFHTLSGLLFFGVDLAFSLGYNSGYMIPSFFLTTAILVFIYLLQPTLIDPSKSKE
jgi:thiamine transporter